MRTTFGKSEIKMIDNIINKKQINKVESNDTYAKYKRRKYIQ